MTFLMAFLVAKTIGSEVISINGPGLKNYFPSYSILHQIDCLLTLIHQ